MLGVRDEVVVDGVDGEKGPLLPTELLGVNANGDEEIEAEDTGGECVCFIAERRPGGGGREMWCGLSDIVVVAVVVAVVVVDSCGGGHSVGDYEWRRERMSAITERNLKLCLAHSLEHCASLAKNVEHVEQR